ENFFTGLNSFKCFGINDIKFADKFGFTHDEVQSLLAEYGYSDKMDVLQEWYDGYCFGNNQSIYCPWNVMQYLFDLQDSQNARPKTYWKNTSSNDVVEYFLYNYMEKLDDKITTLLNHGCIDADIKEDLTYKNLYDSEENLWTLLYLTGYLTKIPDTHDEEDTMLELRIPNKEIFTIFTQTIESVFRRRIDGNESLDPLYDAFWKREDEKVTEILSDLFLTTMSFHDYYEVYYHAILVGVFKQKYKHTTSNYESGLGRADIIVKDRTNKRAAVIEIKKHCDTEQPLSSSADRALRQIADMKYDVLLQGDYSVILHWGIACQDKSCVAKSVAASKQAKAN
ncbi:MAG: PD-(D/E)XK nuclease domain-containing protein, partial [Desulfovibrionaceae bacterium]|nr:PD-(D/E)XK nuclease domain-containing protein [Desulfovibrionaceae bacterium]